MVNEPPVILRSLRKVDTRNKFTNLRTRIWIMIICVQKCIQNLPGISFFNLKLGHFALMRADTSGSANSCGCHFLARACHTSSDAVFKISVAKRSRV